MELYYSVFKDIKVWLMGSFDTESSNGCRKMIMEADVNFFIWHDLHICHRSKQVMFRLLRKIARLGDQNHRLQSRNKNLWFFFFFFGGFHGISDVVDGEKGKVLIPFVNKVSNSLKKIKLVAHTCNINRRQTTIALGVQCNIK